MPKTVTATRQLKATPERVFRAWTDPADVKRWFKPTRLIMEAKVAPLAFRSGMAGQAVAPLRTVHPPRAPAALRADLDVRGHSRAREHRTRRDGGQGRRYRSQVDSFRIARRRGREPPEGLGGDPLVTRRPALTSFLTRTIRRLPATTPPAPAPSLRSRVPSTTDPSTAIPDRRSPAPAA